MRLDFPDLLFVLSTNACEASCRRRRRVRPLSSPEPTNRLASAADNPRETPRESSSVVQNLKKSEPVIRRFLCL